MKSSLRKQQKGAVAIEFALVFVIFFAVFYGLVAYSLPLLLMQSFNKATAEAVRRAVAVDPATSDYPTALQNQANAVLTQQLAWIPEQFALKVGVDTSSVYDTTSSTLTVTVAYPSAKLSQVFPLLVLPGIGTVPSLPTTLSATSSLQF
ncbi:pilus assembly protein TadE [Pseudomonas sp. FW300-N1A1]|uniref:TadE/TadG family type IV pilus assembly protein n=1 Tax=Pseudomonas sp. FW300-N1A1 TaxID=2075555 RepID=UPI000CD2220E|nr:TadE/TadG family type IV pilus assembly protein [Pseudomonas sp. FW300-N1A1]POA20042.1 pilus assembly protein TadE [Pseudomonas sp. FW300-N1A1]